MVAGCKLKSVCFGGQIPKPTSNYSNYKTNHMIIITNQSALSGRLLQRHVGLYSYLTFSFSFLKMCSLTLPGQNHV